MSNETHSRIQKQPPLSKSPSADELIRQNVESGAPDSVLNPASMIPADVLRLQRTIGNHAVQRLISKAPRASTITPASVMIQRQGTYAPINIQLAGNVNAIEEQEYGQGPTVAFTSITSCVGFLARAGNQVYGLHLGVMDGNAVNVSTVNLANLAQAIGAIWPANPDAVYQVGMVNNWDPAVLNGLYPGLLNADEMSAELNQSGKIYSATVNGGGKMEVYKDGVLNYTEP